MNDITALEIFEDGISDTFAQLMKMDFIKKLVDENPQIIRANDIQRLSIISGQEESKRKELVTKLLQEMMTRDLVTQREKDSTEVKRLSW